MVRAVVHPPVTSICSSRRISDVDASAPSGVVQIVSNGGNGGAGGTAADQQTGNGGNGGNGANSTNITATFAESTATQIIVNGTGPALVASTTGGSGAAGGAAGTYGYGGTSGTGGTAGDITVNFGTSQTNVPATIDSKGSAPGIVLSSLGGSTGDAGWGTRAGLQSIRGPSAGAAGSGGAISATINASVSNGITAVSQGGTGGAGGQAISAWNADGGNGGAGGAGGDITLNLAGGSVTATGAAIGTGATSQLDSYSNPQLPVTVTTSLVTAAISALSQGGLAAREATPTACLAFQVTRAPVVSRVPEGRSTSPSPPQGSVTQRSSPPRAMGQSESPLSALGVRGATAPRPARCSGALVAMARRVETPTLCPWISATPGRDTNSSPPAVRCPRPS